MILELMLINTGVFVLILVVMLLVLAMTPKKKKNSKKKVKEDLNEIKKQINGD